MTYFANVLNAEIFTIFLPPDFTATSGNRTTTSKQRGVEAYITARPIPRIRVDAAYTYLRAREDGLEEVRRPKHIGSVNLSYLADRFTGTVTARYNGRQTDLAYTDPSFVPLRVSLKDYVLLNLAADYRLSETVSLFGRIENAMDEDYEEIFSAATPGRAVYAGLRARF